MPQPFDYIIGGQQSPAASMLESLNLARGLSQMQAQKQEAQRAAEASQQLQGDIAALGPSPTPSALANLMVKYPTMSEQFKRGYDALSAEQQKARVGQASRVYAALEGGNNEVAVDLLNEHAEAYRSVGDEQNAKASEDFARLVEMSPESARTTVGIMLASTMGADEFSKTFTQLQGERREAEMQPGALEKAAADLGLTRAETNRVMAQTRKMDMEAKKMAIEMEAIEKAGGTDPSKKFDQEKKLRDEYQKRTQLYSDASTTFENLEASAGEETGPGDIALITSFMKMLDPGSVVRETEFANARNTAGLLDQLMNQAEAIQSGRLFSLDSKQRGEYLSLARQYLDAAKRKADEERANLGVVVENYSLTPENVFGLTEEERRQQPAEEGAEAPQQPSYMRHAR